MKTKNYNEYIFFISCNCKKCKENKIKTRKVTISLSRKNALFIINKMNFEIDLEIKTNIKTVKIQGVETYILPN